MHRTILHGCATTAASYVQLLGAAGFCDLLLTDPPFCLLMRRRPGGDLRTIVQAADDASLCAASCCDEVSWLLLR